jgi:DNA ligase-1
MKAFSELYDRLDRTRSTNAKVAALADWLAHADPADAAWAVALLTGRRPRRMVKVRALADQACAAAGVPGWLFGECYTAVGDVAETIALVCDGLPATGAEDLPLHIWMDDRLVPLADADEATQQARIGRWLLELGTRERFLLVKMVTGAFRVGVSRTLVARALGQVAGVDQAAIAARMMGTWTPTPQGYLDLLSDGPRQREPSQPYPFFLAHPIDGAPHELGPVSAWQAEWKWDGIRGQLIKRDGQVWIWSRGEELVTERYPEVVAAAQALPDGTVLDGELLGWQDGAPLPFSALQRRINRKKPGKKLLSEVPVHLVAYDVLELEDQDWRARPLQDRRGALERVLPPDWPRSQVVAADSWQDLADQRDQSRARHVEGLMLKRLGSPYRTGRPKGDWWKWKVDPLQIDAVLTYAQKGSGRRSSRFTDYTFALWRGDELVTVAKAYTGLTNDQIDQLDAWVRSHTLERFGPVRRVAPEHVFELHFDSVQRSKRHKSGVAVRFPRMGRWRTDKRPQDADRLETLIALIS